MNGWYGTRGREHLLFLRFSEPDFLCLFYAREKLVKSRLCKHFDFWDKFTAMWWSFQKKKKSIRFKSHSIIRKKCFWKTRNRNEKTVKNQSNLSHSPENRKANISERITTNKHCYDICPDMIIIICNMMVFLTFSF